ncbi:hypothetical protein E3N88_06760 [Mikania micrantha]|uniref:Uncharacterized protein n=1 Tax=Mikania micrantha TaxID=192012 RepID=A0A5N6PPJ7_9ASTR|nr:hypothetical protein E3N88_06760 [Mikania micrantha]
MGYSVKYVQVTIIETEDAEALIKYPPTQISANPTSMASSLLISAICLLLLSFTRADVAVVDPATEISLHLSGDELDWRTSSMSFYDGVDEIGIEDDEDTSTGAGRRSLFWKRMRYYISYGALAANRVPCPPRSGRSYYTHDCWRARGPARPYTRGCSTITRCRR